MKLKRTTIGGMAATLLFAVGCGSTGGGAATGGSGGAAGSGEGGKASGGSGGTATGGNGTGGATGGTAGGTAGVAGGTGGVAGAAGTGGLAGSAGGSAGGGAGGVAGGTGSVTIPPALAVPAGGTLALQYHGSGVQIYTCTPSGGAGGAAGSGADAGAISYSWILKGPDAKLYDSSGTQVGTHGIGPEWTSSDGSIVNGTKVEQVNATAAGAIPWLLLRASSTSGTGVFSNVTYVQRLNTNGGAAPATGCSASTSGMDTSVSYTADYDFYTGGGVAAWLTPPPNLPTAIAVPSGSTLTIHDHGVGAQIYTCTASGGAGGAGGSSADAGAISYSWVLKGPNAILSDETFAQVGTHGVGPTWTSSDGSMISGTKLAQANSTASGAIPIPWLLLKATSTGSAGVFANITYVQRLNTAGGVAPASGCGAATVSTDASVAYSADYYFFTGGSGAGGAGGNGG
ncbi:MAG TPA: DUF3455 domain-containing protein [Polyangia bacterium]|nr:DUF3455 domain-containing protein [Polyangia bacterium]